VPLIRTEALTVISSFTQRLTTNNINILTSLTVYFSATCIMGIDFSFSDSTVVSTGSSTYGGQFYGQATLDLTNKTNNEMTSMDLVPLDEKRIILTNVLPFVDQDYLELYIEYLSDEVEIVRFDLSHELKDAIVVTFEKNIGTTFKKFRFFKSNQ